MWAVLRSLCTAIGMQGSYKCLKTLLAQAAEVKIRDVDGR